MELDLQEQAHRKGTVMAFHLLLGSGASIPHGAQSLLDHLGLRVGLGNSSAHFRAGVCGYFSLLQAMCPITLHSPNKKRNGASLGIFLCSSGAFLWGVCGSSEPI